MENTRSGILDENMSFRANRMSLYNIQNRNEAGAPFAAKRVEYWGLDGAPGQLLPNDQKAQNRWHSGSKHRLLGDEMARERHFQGRLYLRGQFETTMFNLVQVSFFCMQERGVECEWLQKCAK